MLPQRTRSFSLDLLRSDGPVAQFCRLAIDLRDADRIELEIGSAKYLCDRSGHWVTAVEADRREANAACRYLSADLRRASGRKIGSVCIYRNGFQPFVPADQDRLDRTSSLITELIEHSRAVELAARSLRRERRSRQLLRQQSQELWRRQAIFEQTERMAKVGGWSTDLRSNEMTWTDEIFRITELPIGKSVSVERALSFYKPASRRELSDAIKRTMREHAPFDVELEYVTALGNQRWVRAMGQVEVLDDAPARVFGTFQDVTDKKLQESRFWKAAHHDPLTGLPNRKLFVERKAECLTQAKRKGSAAALLLVDLDNFKMVNDTHGHDAGDAVLRAAATRLLAAVRNNDVVARLGGDEFAVLLADAESDHDAKAICRRILDAFREPIAWKGALLECRASIGIAMFPEHGQRRGDLAKSADLALYKAKADGRNNCAVFEPAMLRDREHRLEALAHVRTALAQDCVHPYYQPVVEIATGRVSGFESLMRWEHPRRGLQLPGAVASTFDDPEVGCAIGDRMRMRVMQDMRRWCDAGVEFGRIGINVAEPEFQRGGLGNRILGDL